MSKKTKKILIIKLGAIGDVVHTTIIASAIKTAHPDWEVHYLTSNGIGILLENNPYIDKVIGWDGKYRKSNRYILETGLKLFNERYDIVFNMTYALRNMIISFLACPKRVVHKVSAKGSWVEDYYQAAKNVIKDLELPQRLYLGVTEEAESVIKSDTDGLPHPYIVVTPGGASDANRQGRLWNIKKWKELTELLQQKYGGTIFVAGAASERCVHKDLLGDGVVLCSGKYNLAESSALFANADLVISGDTGPVHIASAHNVKTLVLLGSTSPDKIKPYGANGYYISTDKDCKYCWQKKCKQLKENEIYTPCMEQITPQMVMDKIAVENMLGN